jgi:hypothetical protein
MHACQERHEGNLLLFYYCHRGPHCSGEPVQPHTTVYLRPSYNSIDKNRNHLDERRANIRQEFCICIVSPQMHRTLRLFSSLSRRHVPGSRLGAASSPPDDDFQWFPNFFNLAEQHALLSAALRKLDAAEPRASRKRRREFLASHPRPRQDPPKHAAGVLENAFLPDDLYHFDEVRPISFLLWRLPVSRLRKPASPRGAGTL